MNNSTTAKCDFEPPKKVTNDQRAAKKTIVPSRMKFKNTSSTVANNQFKELNKPKKPLTAYNFFFQHERMRILEERGYTHVDHNKQTPNECTNLKRRGRPRGKNYKKKNPHRLIGFEDLSKTIGRRWADEKEDYQVKVKSLVDKDQERYRLEMEEYNKVTKSLVESTGDSRAVCSRQSKRQHHDTTHEEPKNYPVASTRIQPSPCLPFIDKNGTSNFHPHPSNKLYEIDPRKQKSDNFNGCSDIYHNGHFVNNDGGANESHQLSSFDQVNPFEKHLDNGPEHVQDSSQLTNRMEESYGCDK